MRMALHPNLPQVDDHGTLLLAMEEMRASVERLVSLDKNVGEGSVIFRGPPSAPLPAGGLRDLELVYRYTSIDEMEVDRVHTGLYTVVRQIARPLKQSGIWTVVEDLEGVPIFLGIYDLLASTLMSPDVSFALPVDSVMLILDPFLHATGESVLLRVNNPTHIIPLNLVPVDSLPRALLPRLALWLDQGSAVPTPTPPGLTPSALAAEGNVLFKQGKFARAAAKYSHVLELLPDDAVTLSSRALCMLNLDEACMAARDARRALSLAPGPP